MSTEVIIEETSAAALASRFINQTAKHVFLTGKAGTGKTTFLKNIIKNTHKKTVVAAPTGIAAINAGGVTLHSLFQLPFGAFVPDRSSNITLHRNQKINNRYTLIKELQLAGVKRKLIREMELLIIDEVSMLRADLLDAIDTVLRTVRRQQNKAFGGVQLLFIGDLLQLPPVVKDDEWEILKNYYNSIFFFEAHAFKQDKPVYIELEKIYRQSDNKFISLLNNLRSNQLTKEDIDLLNNYYKPDFKAAENDSYIYLTTHNHKADNINREALKKLTAKSHFYRAVVEGEFKEFAYPVEETLELKVGAQIMFLKNDPTGQQKFFNGKIGKVLSLENNEIKVSFDDGKAPIKVDLYKWENKKYSVNDATNEIEEKVQGTFSHYPIKLAWAITVHKSQGLTFNKAIVEVGAAFAPGQVYVALSRLTSLDGLVLTSPVNYSSISEEKSVTAFSETKKIQEPLEKILEKESETFLKEYVLSAFSFSRLQENLQKHIESYNRDEKKSIKQKHAAWAVQLKADFEPNVAVADKFVAQLKQLTAAERTDLKLLSERIASAKNYFDPIFKKLSGMVLKHIEALKKEKKVKAYLNELLEIEGLFFKQQQQIAKAATMVSSVISNTEFTVAEILPEKEKQERAELINGAAKTEKKAKAAKGQTQQESFNLYKQGKTIEQIAAERSLSPLTIEGHLAQFVAKGSLKAEEFVEKEKLENIITVSKTLGTTLFNTIKQALGDEYTYTDIRFAIAKLVAES
jgi:nucleoside-triphosphatase THEP1